MFGVEVRGEKLLIWGGGRVWGGSPGEKAVANFFRAHPVTGVCSVFLLSPKLIV